MNIQCMLKQIADAGFTDSAIAKELSEAGDRIAPSLVNRWRNGVHKRISYERYLKVASIHSKICKSDNHDQNNQPQNQTIGMGFRKL